MVAYERIKYMSDETTILGGTPMVDFEEASEFLRKRAPNPCPACGTNHWGIQGNVQTPHGPVTSGLAGIRISNGALLTQGLPVIMVTCHKCAFIRLHGLVEISKWIEAGRPDYVEGA